MRSQSASPTAPRSKSTSTAPSTSSKVAPATSAVPTTTTPTTSRHPPARSANPPAEHAIPGGSGIQTSLPPAQSWDERRPDAVLNRHPTYGRSPAPATDKKGTETKMTEAALRGLDATGDPVFEAAAETVAGWA